RRGAPSAGSVVGRPPPGRVPYAVIGVAAFGLVILGPCLRPGPRARLLAGLVVIDLVVFTLLGVVAALPGLGGGPGATARHATGAAATMNRGDRTAAPTSPPRPIAALGYPGRFAIYDPDLIHGDELRLLGSPDLNAVSRTPSVQGYSSTVDGHSAAAGPAQAMGEGQSELEPRVVGDGTLDQLGPSILLTAPAYLITAAGGSGPSPGPPGTGERDVAADHRATWYFAAPLAVSRLELPDADAKRDAAAGTQIGLMTPGGPIRWLRSGAASTSKLAISLPRPVTSVAVVARARGGPRHLGPPSVAGSDGNGVVANGQLQDALGPPRGGD